MGAEYADYGKYIVIRYPTYWVVADMHQPQPDGPKIVFESRSRKVAHKKAAELHAKDLAK